MVDVVVPPQVASTNGSDNNMGCASTIECIAEKGGVNTHHLIAHTCTSTIDIYET